MKPEAGYLEFDFKVYFNGWREKTVQEINEKNDREALKSLLYTVLLLEERVKKLEGTKNET